MAPEKCYSGITLNRGTYHLLGTTGPVFGLGHHQLHLGHGGGRYSTPRSWARQELALYYWLCLCLCLCLCLHFLLCLFRFLCLCILKQSQMSQSWGMHFQHWRNDFPHPGKNERHIRSSMSVEQNISGMFMHWHIASHHIWYVTGWSEDMWVWCHAMCCAVLYCTVLYCAVWR